jgi:hypothetical protein
MRGKGAFDRIMPRSLPVGKMRLCFARHYIGTIIFRRYKKKMENDFWFRVIVIGASGLSIAALVWALFMM